MNILSYATLKKLASLFIGDDRESIGFKYLSRNDLDELFMHVGCKINTNQNDIRLDKMSRVLIDNNESSTLGNIFTEIIKLADQNKSDNSVLAIINNYLNIDGYKLIKDNTRYILIESNNIVYFNELNNFDKIKSEHKHLIERFNNNDYNGVYTRARTMIETVFDKIYADKTGNSFESNKKFTEKWSWVKKEGLNLDPAKHEKEAVKKLAQTFGTIIENINNLRNGGSDAHSNTSINNLSKHHVELLINSAVTLSLFLLSEYQKHKNAFVLPF